MSDDEATSPPVDVKRKGALCAKLKSRFLWIIIVYMEVLLTQYVLLTYLTPFFPTVAEGMGLTEFASGLIFAGYPIGAVITGPFTAKIIEKIGGKFTVCIGLISAGTFTILFGLSKDNFGLTSPYQEYFFFIFAVLYGAGSALAETGIMIVIENLCPEDYLARVIAMGEMIIGIGCAIGPGLGGALFAHAGSNCRHTREGFAADPDSMFTNETKLEEKVDGCWLITFTIMGISAFVSSIFVAIVIPGKKGEADDDEDESEGFKSALDRSASKEQSLLATSLPSPDDRFLEEGDFDEEKTYLQLALEYKVIPAAVNFLVSSMSFSALTPVLALKLGEDPFNMDSSQIGLVFLVASAIYMVVALSLGFLVDRTPEGSYKKYILIQLSSAGGMVLMLIGWFLVGPAQMPGQPKIVFNESTIDQVDSISAMEHSLAVVIISQLFLGAGSAMYIIPSLPAMLFFIPEENEDGDENPHRGFVTGFWVTIYSASVALGNTAGSSLYENLGMRQMSAVMMIWCALIIVGDIVWIVYIARHFATTKKTARVETPKAVKMSEKPMQELGSYDAPTLPGAAQTDGSYDMDSIGTEFDI